MIGAGWWNKRRKLAEKQPQVEVDEYGEPLDSQIILARLPQGMPDPRGELQDVPRGVKKYRAYLQKHPDDGGAWEGLAYFYDRIYGKYGKYFEDTVIDANDLGDPPETNYRLLSYKANLKALALRPTSMSLRRSVIFSLSDAIGAFSYTPPQVAIVELYGTVQGAQHEKLRLIDETLELIARYPQRWPRKEALHWQIIRAGQLSKMQEWEKAQAAWTEAIVVWQDWTLDTQHDYHDFGKPSYVYKQLFNCAMHLGQYEKAYEHLEAIKYWDPNASLTTEYFALLKVTATPAEVSNYARQRAENGLRYYANQGDDDYLFTVAWWFVQAGDVAKAREYWQYLANNKESAIQEQAQYELDKLDGKSGGATENE